MVDQRHDNREDFIIKEDYAEEAEDLEQEEYYDKYADVFRKKSFMPYIIGGAGFVLLVFIFAMIFSKPDNAVDQNDLQSLDTRIQQLEKKLATIGVMDQILDRLGKLEQKSGVVEKKLADLEKTVTPQIDQIIKELGALHQKISQKPSSGVAAQKSVEKKPQTASKKSETKTVIHVVQPGETLYRISRRYNLTVEQLRRFNNLASDAAIYPGQKLKLSANDKQ